MILTAISFSLLLAVANANQYENQQAQQNQNPYAVPLHGVPVTSAGAAYPYYSAPPSFQHQQRSFFDGAQNTLNYISQPLPLFRPRYPLTPPALSYRVGIISDLDKFSKDGDKLFTSFLKEGSLKIAPNKQDKDTSKISIDWEDHAVHNITSGLAYSGRGMELSTLNVFNGKFYSCDDKTGIVFELPIGDDDTNSSLVPIPWVILADGNFTGPTGFKCEWGTIKDNDLWIGGHGKHIYNKKGEIVNSNDRFVKRITTRGEVTHLDWSENFDKMSKALDIHMPGYVIHEAAGWSDILQKWIFMPRKVSKEAFDVVRDAEIGNHIILIADEDFNNIEMVELEDTAPTHGFSGFKFIPETNDQHVVALRTIEDGDESKSFILAFDLKGNILMNETEITNQKYEAIEFL